MLELLGKLGSMAIRTASAAKTVLASNPILRLGVGAGGAAVAIGTGVAAGSYVAGKGIGAGAESAAEGTKSAADKIKEGGITAILIIGTVLLIITGAIYIFTRKAKA